MIVHVDDRLVDDCVLTDDNDDDFDDDDDAGYDNYEAAQPQFGRLPYKFCLEKSTKYL